MNIESSRVFPNEETFLKIYEECLGEAPQASKRVTDAYEAMHDAFEEYLDAVQEYVFHYAYQCGYEAARKEYQKHAVPVCFLKGGTSV